MAAKVAAKESNTGNDAMANISKVNFTGAAWVKVVDGQRIVNCRCKGKAAWQNPVEVEVEFNLLGNYAVVLPYGRNWQQSVDAALAAAAFVLGQPVILKRKNLVA